MKDYLKGIRIVDLSMWWSAPLCTSFLGALGAEVIKVESKKTPDGFRFQMAKPGTDHWWELGPQFNSANMNKKGATFDLNDEDGKSYLKELIKLSDIVIENYTPRVMKNFGLTYDVVKELNPSIIMMSMPAYGLSGPWRDEPGFAYTFEILSGIAHLTGYQDAGPMTVLGTGDIISGYHAIFALLSALEYREQTGKGQFIECAQVEAAMNYMGAPLADYQLNDRVWSRIGNRERGIAPQGAYKAQGHDAWVAVSITNNEEWAALCKAIGKPELAQMYASYQERFAHHDEIDEAITAWTMQYTHHEAAQKLREANIPAAPTLGIHEIVEHEYLSDLFQEIERDFVGSHKYPSWPLFINGERLRHRKPTPTLGQDNQYVYKELLNVSDEEYERLLAKGIIGTDMLSI